MFLILSNWCELSLVPGLCLYPCLSALRYLSGTVDTSLAYLK